MGNEGGLFAESEYFSATALRKVRHPGRAAICNDAAQTRDRTETAAFEKIPCLRLLKPLMSKISERCNVFERMFGARLTQLSQGNA